MANLNTATPSRATIVLAGATGDLGGRIARSLLQQGANVRAIVRLGSSGVKITGLRELGASIVEADFNNIAALRKACSGADCVVSALSGLRDVIVDAQTVLLQAAVDAGVPRFIPSDYAIDFTKLPAGTNRNLDLRREFGDRLDKAPIAATSILNGMFTELLTGQAPVILFGLKRVAYWGNDNQLLDFTTIENTAVFTAAAALDPTAPRYLRIAGDTMSAQGLKEAASEVTGKAFKLLRAGDLSRLDKLIKITRTLLPKREEVFPPWQGMQYLRNMFSGKSKLEPLDNDRYPQMQWTTVRKVFARHLNQARS
jgi:uncharacterized protein YbjT (DUF2867 family)